MSKLLFSLAFVILFVVVCSSQNLVPNPSFEDTTGCPEIWSEIDKAKGWNACGYGTPDFFCNCPKAGNLMGVPFNFNGFQLARTGNGYAGIYTYNGSVPTGVEIITAKLVTPLIKGGKYYVKFFVSRADDTLSVNKIGVRFSMDSCNKLSNVALNNFAHIYTNSVITDRISWSQISGVLIADSAYKYISIGNFFTQPQTSIIPQNGGSLNSFYYIDDICVSLDPNKCHILASVNEADANDGINVNPNPSNGLTRLVCDDSEIIKKIIVVNIAGKEVRSLDNINSSDYSLDLVSLENGIYFLTIDLGDKKISKRIIKSE